MLLFLDFDGVLHSAYGGKGSPAFCRAGFLANALEGHDVSIVITSSYREHHAIDHLKSLLGPLGRRVIGTTPLLTGPFVRQREIEAWLERNPLHANARYVVLDDDPRLFSISWAPLTLCQPGTGIDSDTLGALMQRVQGSRGNQAIS